MNFSASRVRNWVGEHMRPLAAITIWALIALITRQVMLANDLTFNDLITLLGDFLRTSWFGPVIYVAIYLIRPLILFPASLLTILGGSVFGIMPGFVIVLLAGTASAVLPYSIGRWFSSGEQQPASDTLIQRFVRAMQGNPFQTVLLMRLLYLPYDAVSLLAGSMRIPFLVFFSATAIGNLAGTFSFVGIGASIEGDLASGNVTLNPWMLGFSVFILIASIGVSRLLKNRQTVSA
jgi:uncharacterized membrane protein YdjX (TVP38/TMEM64 family)